MSEPPATRSGSGCPPRRAAHTSGIPSATVRVAARIRLRNSGSRPVCRQMSTLGVTTHPPSPARLALMMCCTAWCSVSASKSRPASLTCWFRAGMSVGAHSADDRLAGLPKDLQVEQERPVLDVPEIEPDRFLPGQIGSAADLPQPGDAGLDGQSPRYHIL